MTDSLWDAVDAVVGRAPSMDELRLHGLHLLAAQRLRAQGRDVPFDIAAQELIGVQIAHHAERALRAIAECAPADVLVLKGLEAAAAYPDPLLRSWGDLDVLAADPHALRAAMERAGFVTIGPREDSYFEGLHHLRPMRLPEPGSVVVEVHRHPNWIDWRDPPSASRLIDCSLPSTLGIDGVRRLPPAEHAVVMAVHSWVELPLRRLGDLVDAAALLEQTDRETALAVAREWRIERLWRTTVAAIDAAFAPGARDARTPWWAGDVTAVTGRTVLGNHLRRWLAPFWALPPHRAAARSLGKLFEDVTPAPNETWRQKGQRSREAAAHPNRVVDQHDAVVGRGAPQPRMKRRYRGRDRPPAQRTR